MRFLLFFFPLLVLQSLGVGGSVYCATPPNTPREESKEVKSAQHMQLHIRLTQSGEGQVEKVINRKLVLMQMQEKARVEKEKEEKS